MPTQPSVKVCTYIKVTGVRCGSPPLRGEQFATSTNAWCAASPLRPAPAFESEEAIQASLMEVINALARNTIHLRRAELLLRALHIAVRNARRPLQPQRKRNGPRNPHLPRPTECRATRPRTPSRNQPCTADPPLQTWATLTLEAAEANPTRRKPPARAGLPPEKKNAVMQKGG